MKAARMLTVSQGEVSLKVGFGLVLAVLRARATGFNEVLLNDACFCGVL